MAPTSIEDIVPGECGGWVADRKDKNKWKTPDPNNTRWANDKQNFGFRMLQKMGWSEGKGLGIEEQGATSFIKVNLKPDTKGLGDETDSSKNWLETASQYDNLLAKLNNIYSGPKKEETEDESSTESSEEEEKVLVEKRKKAAKSSKKSKRRKEDSDEEEEEENKRPKKSRKEGKRSKKSKSKKSSSDSDKKKKRKRKTFSDDDDDDDDDSSSRYKKRVREEKSSTPKRGRHFAKSLETFSSADLAAVFGR